MNRVTARAGRIGAICVVALVLGMSLVSIARGREMWPFSPYPMYSRPQTGEVRMLFVQGRGPGGWFDLTAAHVAPLKRSLLLSAVRRGSEPGRLDERLDAVGSLYERRRRQ